MPCYSPGQAWPGALNLVTGKRPSVWQRNHRLSREIPCGRCLGCRRDNALMWSVRAWHESQTHQKNCIVTLTYSEEKNPHELSFDTIQNWLDVLRHRKDVQPFRYFLSGEYMQSGAPHYHVCLFGHDFDDKYFWKMSPTGDKLCRSPLLESTWENGFALIGTLDFKSAAYCAGYVLKKIYADPSKTDTRQAEFRLMSTRPALGKIWFEKNWKETTRDEIVTPSGLTMPLPRYYFNLLEKISPHDADIIRRSRSSSSTGQVPDFGRLQTKEAYQYQKNKLRGKS